MVERGPRRDPQASRRERGDQPARRRPDGLRQHLGARRARARTHADVRLARRAGEGAALHASTTRSPPASPARPARSLRAARVRRTLRRRHRPAPPPTHVDPETGQVDPEPTHPGNSLSLAPAPRNSPVPSAFSHTTAPVPSAPAWPAVERSSPALSPRGDALRRASHYDSLRPSRPVTQPAVSA